MPEFKQRGNLQSCAREVREHFEWLRFVYGPNLEQDAQDRLHTACSGYGKILEKLEAIKILAEKTNNQELLALMREEFGYGLLINFWR